MGKKVFRGWVAKDTTEEDVLIVDNNHPAVDDKGNASYAGLLGTAEYYPVWDEPWKDIWGEVGPPKKVTITVEVED